MNKDCIDDLNLLYETIKLYSWINNKNKKCSKINYKKYLEKYKILKSKFKNTDIDSQDTLYRVKEYLDEIKFWECY